MSIFKQTTQFLFCLVILTSHFSCSTPQKPQSPTAILPLPVSIEVTNGNFTLSGATKLTFDQEFKQVASFFKSYIQSGSSIKLESKPSSNTIVFKNNSTINNPEGYELHITNKKITLSASSPKGAFYGVQTLRQLLPPAFENGTYTKNTVPIQNAIIQDAPKFKYRGLHLDVGRHFFSVDFIKKYIDMMSMLKMNTFHWHLTEDQGWRIEIKKYPKLQEVAAYRNETLVGHYSDQPHQFDGKKYGGYYTQEEVKEIVAYASMRQVTVIPEIEMPGHSRAALSAYPELGCTEKPIDVATKWGVFEDIYCSKEATFKFLEDVLDEVIPLFPGKYIHIGGDEAPKKRWKSCKNCQRVIKREGLKDEHELQSYFIERMEKYINSKGKQIIGWDEILEGGLAPNATVMSWRGINGAIVAAKQHHDVILTPGSHCYFDHYQSTNEHEPVAIGGFLPLEKVYNFDPIPSELTKEEAKYVLGAQGNVWTEYIPTPEHVEYMAYPRAIALSEVVWSYPAKRDYENFKERLVNYQNRLDLLNVNYANHLYELSGTLTTKDNKIRYALNASSHDQYIRYTTDGSIPTISSTIYKNPIPITKTTIIHAASFSKTKLISSIFNETIHFHLGLGKKVNVSVAPNKRYNSGGIKALVNGLKGSDSRYGDKEWLGFSGDDVDVIIDLGKETNINSIKTRFHNGRGNWIYAPSQVVISFPGSEEALTKKIPNSKNKVVSFSAKTKMFTRYIKIQVKNFGKIPQGNAGAGNRAWLFIDEIIIE